MTEHVATQREFLEDQLEPRLKEARRGRRQVYLVDAAHFVFGAFLCCLWSMTRVFVRAASGRQRFNVLGAWNAMTRELVSVVNTTVVNSEAMCELLRKIRAARPRGDVTLVLDNARSQKNEMVQSLAAELKVELLFLPSYSPNLNLIERLWRLVKRRAAYGHWHRTFADFRAAIEEVLNGVSTVHEGLARLAHDPSVPSVRGRLTLGRVEYNSRWPRRPRHSLWRKAFRTIIDHTLCWCGGFP